ncbi:hypothetical protein ACFY05_01235 [Microtetraspora fusca]|uniref:Orn/DAP/Arg decarboxylase 2 C-terminal domain-containing protein n=1 Tax=Microtetraspora fusca TaxID=1997 RepID=A0ABW6UWN4_MICFU
MDVIAQGVEHPANLRPGDLIVVAATGAYRHSMASTYNMTAGPCHRPRQVARRVAIPGTSKWSARSAF